jgi:sialate O-acetylesterase
MGFQLMLSKRVLIALVALGLWSVNFNAAFAQPPAPETAGAAPAAVTPASLPFVSPMFGDNMVLQRNKADKIWGWSEPGDTVRVEIAGNTASAVAGADRRWQVEIQPPAAGGPYTVKISGQQSVELHNVLVGDVWLCGGQSNMEFKLRGALNGPEEIKAANFPQIRFFNVGQHAAYHPAEIVRGSWNVVSPNTAAQLSAVAYYFARRVQQDVHIPIGLIVDCVGGTPAETWTSAATLRQLGGLDVPLAELERVSKESGPEYGNYVMAWYDRYDTGLKQKWFDPAFDDAGWKPVDLFGGFAALGVPETPAVVWFRKDLVLPDPLPPGRAMLSLGVVERMDTVYINGRFMGGSSWVENPRRYRIPEGLLKPGHNSVVIRVLKTKPDGGFQSKPANLNLTFGDDTTISMVDGWKAKVSVDARPPHDLPISYENWPVMPAVLYMGMLEPVAPLSITGAIWYQGEANAKRAYEYRKVMPAMIADWRKLFGQGDFPFYIVGLPFYMQHSPTPVDGDEWAELRESQAVTVATVPNTCLATIIDTGAADTVHPPVKIPAGDRLAFCALAKNYDEKIPYQGPTFASADMLGTAIRVHFAHAEGGIVVKGGKPGEFAIAGDDHKWYPADAHVFGDTVIVSASAVPNPKAVRYAWQSNPEATLYNKAGLPAVPFRTDDWPELTENRRPY